MSTVYSLEPNTNGKVRLETNYGDIDIEIWGKESPKGCRNFVQLCLEGYYNGTEFHRVEAGYLIQAGDPTGTGYGGDSVYGGSFDKEFNSRLRFSHRGVVAYTEDNKSQFFITLATCPDLNKKYTIFGKVTGNTIFNVLNIGEVSVDRDGRPSNPVVIRSARVLVNPFSDLKPRFEAVDELSGDFKEKQGHQSTAVASKKGTSRYKNAQILSFFSKEDDQDSEAGDLLPKPMQRCKTAGGLARNPELVSQHTADTGTLNPDTNVDTPEFSKVHTERLSSADAENMSLKENEDCQTTNPNHLLDSPIVEPPSVRYSKQFLEENRKKYVMGTAEDRKRAMQAKSQASFSKLSQKLSILKAKK